MKRKQTQDRDVWRNAVLKSNQLIDDFTSQSQVAIWFTRDGST